VDEAHSDASCLLSGVVAFVCVVALTAADAEVAGVIKAAQQQQGQQGQLPQDMAARRLMARMCVWRF
jgi:hypothetical protein